MKKILIILMCLLLFSNMAYANGESYKNPVADLELIKEYYEANKTISSMYQYDAIKVGESKTVTVGGQFSTGPDKIEEKHAVYEVIVEKEGAVSVKAILKDGKFDSYATVRINYVQDNNGTHSVERPPLVQNVNNMLTFYAFPGTYYIIVGGDNYSSPGKKGTDKIYLSCDLSISEENSMTIDDFDIPIVQDNSTVKGLRFYIKDSIDELKYVNADVTVNGKTKETEKLKHPQADYYYSEVTFENVKKGVELSVTVKANGYETLNTAVNISSTEHSNDTITKTLYLKKAKEVKNIGTASVWAKEEIENAIKVGLQTEGMTSGSYKDKATRENFAELALELFNKLGGESYGVGNNPFTDTTNFKVISANKIGIINGTSKTTFNPNGELTREQLCTMIVRTLDKAGISYKKDVEFQKQYSDIENISGWALESTRVLNHYGIVNGNGDSLNPKNSVTKEQAMIILYRTYEMFK